MKQKKSRAVANLKYYYSRLILPDHTKKVVQSILDTIAKNSDGKLYLLSGEDGNTYFELRRAENSLSTIPSLCLTTETPDYETSRMVPKYTFLSPETLTNYIDDYLVEIDAGIKKSNTQKSNKTSLSKEQTDTELYANLLISKIQDLNLPPYQKERVIRVLKYLGSEEGKKLYINRDAAHEEYLAITNSKLKLHTKDYTYSGTKSQSYSRIITTSELIPLVDKNKDEIEQSISFRRRLY